MTYPDDILKAAREAAAQSAESRGLEVLPEMYRDGTYDTTHEVKTACIAIMAERQRCAEAAEVSQTGSDNSWEKGYETAAKHIKAAILGQQEPSAE